MSDLSASARNAIAKLNELLVAYKELEAVQEEVRQAQIECDVWSFQIERLRREAKEFRDGVDRERGEADRRHRQEVAKYRQELHGVMGAITAARAEANQLRNRL